MYSDFVFAQEEDEIADTIDIVEIYLIDNYVKSEKDKILVLSWMTNIPVKSKVEIVNIGVFNVSDTLTDFHQAKIDLSNFNIVKEENFFNIISELEDGLTIKSDEYSFLIPLESQSQTKTQQTHKSSAYYIYNFFVGMALWLIPSPALALENNKTKFAVIKDLPVVSIGSSSAFKTFPYVCFYAGYSHIPDGYLKNSFRFGGKYLYEIKNLRHFLSLGFGGFTNFKGSTGFSAEAGFSFLKILRTFEMFASYSYNFLPASKHKYHLINLGLFTSSFSINLNF